MRFAASDPRTYASVSDVTVMPKRPKSRHEENGDDSDRTEHEQMIRALQEAAARLAKAREALNKRARSGDTDDDPDGGREW